MTGVQTCALPILHPQKTRRVELTDGLEGFDFLGCHLHKRMSGRLWQQKGLRRYYLQRWSGRKAMNRVRERVRELTPRKRSANPILAPMMKAC